MSKQIEAAPEESAPAQTRAAPTPAPAKVQSAPDSAPSSSPAAARAAAPPQTVHRRPARPRRRFGGRQRRKVCVFCVEKIQKIDYKDTTRLRRFISDRATMLGRRKSSNCAKHQRRLSVAIKRARFLALLPYTGEHVRDAMRAGLSELPVQ